MSDIPIPNPAKKNVVGDAPTLSVGAFYAEHRALVDARKTHLARVGVGPALAESASPAVDAPHELPSQAKVLAMPTGEEAPLVALPKEAVPETPPAKYEARKLPKLPGVNADLTE